MATQQNLEQQLQGGALDSTLARLYGADGIASARTRCADLIERHHKAFGRRPQALFSAPGRTELGGNHTDHQRGRVLAASINLDILAAVSPGPGGVLRVRSQGYPLQEVDLGDLAPRPGERNQSIALIRGVAARLRALGCPMPDQGLDITAVSNIPMGSGLSSSAAFEVLMGAILNQLCWDGRLSPVEIAQVGQYAENVYFEKPCGLMDQTASSVGGVVAIDFEDAARPRVEQVPFDFAATGHALCILDSGADHADLTGDYAAITRELKTVCGYFSKEVLREVPEEEFLAALPQLRRLAGDRGVLRGLHFYAENRRAAQQAQALGAGDFPRFLELVRQSGASSALYLQNVVPEGRVTRQELLFTIALCEKFLEGGGAVRVHGGGFAGTAQAFVPLELLPRFRAVVEAVLGQGSCHVLSIRPVGAVRL